MPLAHGLSGEKQLAPARGSRARETSVKTVFPKVISASRATDLPAFHAAWFMERFRKGHCEWQNPFNAKQKQIVSFAEASLLVFWSKNPAPLMPYLGEIYDAGKRFYFQFTLNDYEKEGLEPQLPPLAERVTTFIALSKKYKTIWRYDPILLDGRLNIQTHMRKLAYLMERLGEWTDRLIFSFVDFHPRVAANLKRYDPKLKAANSEEMRQFCEALLELRDKRAPGLKLASCAEPGLDCLPGIEKGGCIDPALINALCGKEIYRPRKPKPSPAQFKLFDADLNKAAPIVEFEKDKGQRKACQCAPSKDIGSHNLHPCKHGCLYCYAGHAKKLQ